MGISSISPNVTHDRAGSAVIRQRSLLAVAFQILLWATVDLRLWPHLYAGERPTFAIHAAMLSVMAPASAGLILILFRKSVLDFFRLNLALCGFLLFALVHSLFLSSDISTSLSLFLDYVIVCIVAVGAVQCLTTKEFEKELWIFAVGFVVLNAGAALVIPGAWMSRPHEGLLRGLTRHKNDLGQILVLVFVITLYCGGVSRWVRQVTMAATVVLAIFAFSAQSIFLIALATALKVLAATRTRVGNDIFAILLVLLIILSSVVLFTDVLDTLLSYFGKSSDFTGRDQIWRYFFIDIQERNWLGYGLGVYFSNPDLRSGLVASGVNWDIGTAHSSYIEAFVALGWLGGSLFCFLVARYVAEVTSSFVLQPKLYMFAASLILVSSVGAITASEKLFLPGSGWLTFVIGAVILQVNRRNFKLTAAKTVHP